MVMLGMFFPWKAITLFVCVLKCGGPSKVGEAWRCKCSCCWSLVVVIFVSSPATISIMCSTFISLISYCGLSSPGPLDLDRLRLLTSENAFMSSLAKLCMCSRSRALIFAGPDCRPSTEAEDADGVTPSYPDNDDELSDMALILATEEGLGARCAICCEL